jgi:hypothetical protein
MLCDDLVHHSPAQRIEAGTHPEDIAKQEGVVRAAEFRAGQWRDDPPQ